MLRPPSKTTKFLCRTLSLKPHEEIFVSPVSWHNLVLSKAEFPANGVPEVLRGKHRLRIFWELRHGARRFGELRKRLSSKEEETKAVAARVLSRELKSLVELGLIHRRAYNGIPPRVEYRLTSLRRTVLPVISVIRCSLTSNGSPGASNLVETLNLD